MTVRMHLIEDATRHLSSELLRVLVRHIQIQRDAQMSAREITSTILSSIGMTAASAVKTTIIFGKPGHQAAMYDEAVEKLTALLVDAKPEALAAVERLDR